MEQVRLYLSPYSNFLLSLVNIMKFAVLEPDGRAHEFVLTGDKLGQDALDKVKSTRNAYFPNFLWFDRDVNRYLTPCCLVFRFVKSWVSKRKIILGFDTL